MSILLASIQITIPRAHRRRLSSILKTPSRRRRSAGYFDYQTNGLPRLAHEIRAHIIATQQKTTRKKRPAKKPKPAENVTMGPPCREIVPNCQKTPQGGLFLDPLWRAIQHYDHKPQVANIFNAEFPISSEQHACNEAPLWHFLAETTQQDATQGRMGGRQSVYQAHRRHAHHFTRQTATRADPRTKSQAARATFPRTQALSISTARPRQHGQHFEHQAFPTSPTRPQAAYRRHAR